MSNIYVDSEAVIAKLKSGEIPKGSIISVQWPSGNSQAIRVHGYNYERNKLIGCDMGWDNGATEWYNLSHGVVRLIEKPKPNDERWKS